MRRRDLFQTILSFVLVVEFVVPALAGEPTEKVKQTTDKILKIVSDPAMKNPSKEPERRKLIRKAADERFDWEEMSRRSLARYWAENGSGEERIHPPLWGVVGADLHE